MCSQLGAVRQGGGWMGRCAYQVLNDRSIHKSEIPAYQCLPSRVGSRRSERGRESAVDDGVAGGGDGAAGGDAGAGSRMRARNVVGLSTARVRGPGMGGRSLV